jgi:transcriptional regulator of acetoin/glycerol metabolism
VRLAEADTAALVEREAQLIEAARPYLRALSLAAGAEQHAVLLADARGVVIDMAGVEKTVGLAGGFPSVGMVMSEGIAGSNGIGTALAENDYVEVIGPEHFVQCLSEFTCQGLPLRQSAGRVVGVLAMVVNRVAVAARVREILFCAANGIEAELMRRRIERHVERVRSEEGGAFGHAADVLWQDLVQLQAAARLRLERASDVARHERPQDALRLVLLADELVRRFARQAELWKEFAFDEAGSAQPVDVTERLAEMVQLFATEADVRGVQLALRQSGSVTAFVDPLALSRLLFRAFLQALDTPAAGAAIEISADVLAQSAQVQVSFSTGQTLRFPGVVGGSENAW